MENTLEEIADSLEKGRCKRVKELVLMAVKEGISVSQILDKGLLKGMENVGRRFQTEMVEIPEILSITRAAGCISVCLPLSPSPTISSRSGSADGASDIPTEDIILSVAYC